MIEGQPPTIHHENHEQSTMIRSSYERASEELGSSLIQCMIMYVWMYIYIAHMRWSMLIEIYRHLFCRVLGFGKHPGDVCLNRQDLKYDRCFGMFWLMAQPLHHGILHSSSVQTSGALELRQHLNIVPELCTTRAINTGVSWSFYAQRTILPGKSGKDSAIQLRSKCHGWAPELSQTELDLSKNAK
jgi:hypothetical protein